MKQELDEQAVLNEAGGYWAHWGRGKAGIRMSVDRLLVTNRQKELMGQRYGGELLRAKDQLPAREGALV